MISFKQFLVETWSKGNSNDFATEHYHTADVGPHKVTVGVVHIPQHRMASVSFSVDDKFSTNGIGGNKHALPILKHVKSVVKDFVDTHKPKMITMAAFDRDDEYSQKKDKLYKYMTKEYKSSTRQRGKYKSHVIHLEQLIDYLDKMILSEDWSMKKYASGNRVHYHYAKIGPHEVSTEFCHEHKTNGTNVEFTVNGSANASGMTKEHAIPIIKHVKNVIKQYIDKHKPNTVTFKAYDASATKRVKKEKLYNTIGKSLGKSVTTDSTGQQTIHFEQLQQWVNNLLTEVKDDSLLKRFARRQKVVLAIAANDKDWDVYGIGKQSKAAKGAGAKVMNAIGKLADKRGATVGLSAGGKLRKEYYPKFGYEEDPAHSTDKSAYMKRLPKKGK